MTQPTAHPQTDNLRWIFQSAHDAGRLVSMLSLFPKEAWSSIELKELPTGACVYAACLGQWSVFDLIQQFTDAEDAQGFNLPPDMLATFVEQFVEEHAAFISNEGQLSRKSLAGLGHVLMAGFKGTSPKLDAALVQLYDHTQIDRSIVAPLFASLNCPDGDAFLQAWAAADPRADVLVGVREKYKKQQNNFKHVYAWVKKYAGANDGGSFPTPLPEFQHKDAFAPHMWKQFGTMGAPRRRDFLEHILGPAYQHIQWSPLALFEPTNGKADLDELLERMSPLARQQGLEMLSVHALMYGQTKLPYDVSLDAFLNLIAPYQLKTPDDQEWTWGDFGPAQDPWHTAWKERDMHTRLAVVGSGVSQLGNKMSKSVEILETLDRLHLLSDSFKGKANAYWQLKEQGTLFPSAVYPKPVLEEARQLPQGPSFAFYQAAKRLFERQELSQEVRQDVVDVPRKKI